MKTIHEEWLENGREITIRTVRAPGWLCVYAVRKASTGYEQQTTHQDFGGSLVYRKALAYREAVERWGKPGRVRFVEESRP